MIIYAVVRLDYIASEMDERGFLLNNLRAKSESTITQESIVGLR